MKTWERKEEVQKDVDNLAGVPGLTAVSCRLASLRERSFGVSSPLDITSNIFAYAPFKGQQVQRPRVSDRKEGRKIVCQSSGHSAGGRARIRFVCLISRSLQLFA
jgi:hypothetical protein